MSSKSTAVLRSMFETFSHLLTQCLLQLDDHWQPSSEERVPDDLNEAEQWLQIFRSKVDQFDAEHRDEIIARLDLINFLTVVLRDSYQAKYYAAMKLKSRRSRKRPVIEMDSNSTLPLTKSVDFFFQTVNPANWPNHEGFISLIVDLKTHALIEALSVGKDFEETLNELLPAKPNRQKYPKVLASAMVLRREELLDMEDLDVVNLLAIYNWNAFVANLQKFCRSVALAMYAPQVLKELGVEQQEEASQSQLEVEKKREIEEQPQQQEEDADEEADSESEDQVQHVAGPSAKAIGKQRLAAPDEIDSFPDAELDALVTAALLDNLSHTVPKRYLQRYYEKKGMSMPVVEISPRRVLVESTQEPRVLREIEKVPKARRTGPKQRPVEYVETSDVDEQQQSETALKSAPSRHPSKRSLQERNEDTDDEMRPRKRTPATSTGKKTPRAANATMDLSIHGNRVPGFTPGGDEAAGRWDEGVLFSPGQRRSAQKHTEEKVVKLNFFSEVESEEEEESAGVKERPKVIVQRQAEESSEDEEEESEEEYAPRSARRRERRRSRPPRPAEQIATRPLSSAGQRVHELTPLSDEENNVPIRRFVRRRNMNWTQYEILLLERGLLKFGPGNWAQILLHYGRSEDQGFLPCRTSVDLKDKARNEKARRQRQGADLGAFAHV